MGRDDTAAQGHDLDTSPFEEPSYEKVERGIPGPWERAADRAEAKEGRVERCPESSQEGARCIYEVGHGGKHFAKDAFAYYSWKRLPAQGSRRRWWNDPDSGQMVFLFCFGGVAFVAAAGLIIAWLSGHP